MGFLSPWFLAGLAALSLPLWLHLLRRHRSNPLPFSSLMFFERRTQSSIKHRRLHYLLLYALRTALLALLALAFANPYFESARAPAAGGRKLTLLAVDNSFSMRQGDRLERAKRMALAAAARVAPQNRVQVLAFASQVQMVDAVQAIQPTDAQSSYAELARAVRSVAQSARMPVEVHLFSDMQRTSLPSNFADLRLPEGSTLTVHAVADRRLPNFAVENVNAPRRFVDPRKVRIQATVAGYGTDPATRRVSLLLEGKEQASKTVEVPAGGRATVEFLSLEASHGLSRCEIRTDSGDAFPDDDRYYFSVERSEPRRALVVHDDRDARGALYFRTALEAAADAAFSVDAIPAGAAAGVSPEKYAFVVLSDVGRLNAAFEEALGKYVHSGGSLLVALGPGAAPAKRVPVFDEPIGETRYTAEAPETVSWMNPAHPSMSGAVRWDGIRFYRAVKVNPGKAQVAARLSDETPLLLDKRMGEGRVLVFASTFDNISNDFPLHTAFVPFVQQTAQYLSGMEHDQQHFRVGAYLELRAGGPGAAVEVLEPGGKRALSLEESTRAKNLLLASAGFYDVRRPSGRHELVAVNPDRRESDLDLAPREALDLWRKTGEGQAAAAAEGETERKPVTLWWYVLALGAVVAAAESVIGNRHLSEARDA
ncbi:MAG: BatA domain-containing protein [Bryobacterales bacterium]|nr:BatA domain-containing protein [Bryobacterales bacterium]